MATQTAEPIQQTFVVDVGSPLEDCVADTYGRGEWERRARIERRLAKLDRALAEPKHRAAAWRRLVLKSDLPSNVVRLLCCLTEEFGARLENCFPGRKKMLAKCGAWAKRHTPHLLTKWLTIAERAGWIERVALTRDEDGDLVEVEENGGRFVSAVGIRFRVPPGVIAPGDAGWQGPKVWTKRIYAGRRTR